MKKMTVSALALSLFASCSQELPNEKNSEVMEEVSTEELFKQVIAELGTVVKGGLPTEVINAIKPAFASVGSVRQVVHLKGKIRHAPFIGKPRFSSRISSWSIQPQNTTTPVSLDTTTWKGIYQVNEGSNAEWGEVHAFALLGKAAVQKLKQNKKLQLSGSTFDIDNDFEMGQFPVPGTNEKAWVFAAHQGISLSADFRDISYTICARTVENCK